MTPNFIVAVDALLQICCHICCHIVRMQYLREFVAGIIHVVMCNDRQRNMKTILWLEPRTYAMTRSSFSQKNINAKYFGCVV